MSDFYSCSFCGFVHQGESDSIHGLVWACDECDKLFCTRCAELSIGVGAADYMFLFGEQVLCPECWHEANPDKPFNAPKRITLRRN